MVARSRRAVFLAIQFFHPVEPFFGRVSAPDILRVDAPNWAIQPKIAVVSDLWPRVAPIGFFLGAPIGGSRHMFRCEFFFANLPERGTKITGVLAFGWGGNPSLSAAPIGEIRNVPTVESSLWCVGTADTVKNR